jgi:hypothetical protein
MNRPASRPLIGFAGTAGKSLAVKTLALSSPLLANLLTLVDKSPDAVYFLYHGF